MRRHLQREVATLKLAETTACATSVGSKQGRFDDGIQERKPKSKPTRNRRKKGSK